MTRGGVALAALAIAGLAGVAWLAAADPAPAWQLVAPERLELAVGGNGALEVAIEPADGRTVSRDGPVRVDVAVPDGVTIGRARLALADAVDPGARAPRFAIKLGAARAGTYQVEVAVRLWLCLRQTCKPVRATRTITVDATGAVTPDAAPPPPDAAPPAPPDARRRRRAK